MLYLLFLCSLLRTPIHAMNQCNKKQDFGSLNTFVQYETQRNEAITKSDHNILRRELATCRMGLKPKDIDAFAARYIKYVIAPAAHKKPIVAIQREHIEIFDGTIQDALLNSDRFPTLKPYVLLAALGDARTELLTTQFFHGDRSAALIFEKYPYIQALQLLSEYAHKANPALLSSADVFLMSPDQINICQYIEEIVLNNANLQVMLLDNHPARIPLTHSQEKILATLPGKVLKKSEFQNSFFLCKQPIKDALRDAGMQTFDQRETICIRARAGYLCLLISNLVNSSKVSNCHANSIAMSVVAPAVIDFFAPRGLVPVPAVVVNNYRTVSAIVGGVTELLIRAQPIPTPTLLGAFLPVCITGAAVYNTYNALTALPITKTINEIIVDRAIIKFLDVSKNL
jgi:hypothetical protein